MEDAFWDDALRADHLGRVDVILREVTGSPTRFPQANVREYEAVRAQLAAGSGDYATSLAFWDVEIDRLILAGGARGEGRLWPSRFHVAALHRNGRLDDAAAAAESLVLYCRKFYGLTHEDTVRDTRTLSAVYSRMGLPSTGFLVSRLLVPEANERVDSLFLEGLKDLEAWTETLNVTPEERARLRQTILEIKSGKPTAAELIASARGRAGVLFWLAELCWDRGHPDEALVLAEEARKAGLSVHGPDHPLVAVRATRLAEMWLEHGDLKRVETFLDATMPEGGTKMTWLDGIVLDLGMDLAEHYASTLDDDAAVRAARRVANLRMAQGCAGLAFLARYDDLLKAAAQRSKDPKRLTAVYDEVVPMFVSVFGEGHWATAQRKNRHADSFIGCGRPAEALAMVDAFFAANKEWKVSVEHWWITRGRALVALNRFTEAEECYAAAWEECSRLGYGTPNAPPWINGTTRRIAECYVILYSRLGRKEDQKKWEGIRDSIRIP